MKPRSRSLVAAAALLMATGAFAACSTTADSDDGGSSAGPGPGVTDESIKIGLIALDSADSAGSGGFTVAPQGDSEAQAKALGEWINEQGGIGGRDVEVVVREFASSSGSAQTETALCNSFTQDDEVFAVVTLGQRTNAGLDCYGKAKTLVVDISQSARPGSVVDDHAPYLWTPNAVDLDTSTAALTKHLGEDGVFDDAKVGVVVQEEPAYEDVYENVLVPALEEYGVEPVKVTIDQSTPENAFATAGSAAGTLQSEDATHVMFLGVPDNVGFLTSYTVQQNYFPQLLISSNDTPDFMVMNPAVYPPEAMEGARGIGFYPAVDGIAGEAFPSEIEKPCVDALESAGITFDGRAEAKTALRYCDALSFLKAVGDEVGDDDFNAAEFESAASDVEWTSVTSVGSDMSGVPQAPAANFRPLAFDGKAFEHTGDEQSFR